MIARRIPPPCVALVLANLLAGCQSAPTRFFMLEPVAPVSIAGSYTGPAIAVAAVHIPPALDRSDIVSEVAPGEFKVSDLEQWIAPLGQGIRQALSADLAARLPAGRVIFPHLVKPPGTIAVSVDLLSFDAGPRVATLQVSWLGTSDGAQPGAQPRSIGGTLRLQTPRSGEGAASMASALSALVAQLADRIVTELLLPAPDAG